MGARANIIIKQENNQRIWVYSHWGGNEWAEKLQQAMKEGKPRWDDEQYLTRYIITGMIPHTKGELTGYGVSTYPGDNEYDIYEVSVADQKVRLWPDTLADLPTGEPPASMKPLKEWGFSEFIEAELNPATDDEE